MTELKWDWEGYGVVHIKIPKLTRAKCPTATSKLVFEHLFLSDRVTVSMYDGVRLFCFEFIRHLVSEVGPQKFIHHVMSESNMFLLHYGLRIIDINTT